MFTIGSHCMRSVRLGAVVFNKFLLLDVLILMALGWLGHV